MEIWKDVVGYEGSYQVSNLGNVKGMSRISLQGRPLAEKPLAGSVNHKGYARVALTDRAGVRKNHSIHRLVLAAFVGPCPDGMEGCHKDGNSRDNTLGNLRWDSPVANWADRRTHGTATIGAKHPMAKITEETARAIKERLKDDIAVRLLAAEFDVSVGTVAQIKRGNTWSHVHV